MNKQILVAGYFAASLLLPFLAHGDVYQWVDEKGQVHFGNVPPKQQGPYKLGGYDHDSTSSASAANESSNAQTGSPAQQVPVQQTAPHADSASTVAQPGKTVDTATPVVSPIPAAVTPTVDVKPKAVVSPLELENLIKRLRQEAKPPRNTSVVSPANAVVEKPEVQTPEAQKPTLQKPNAHVMENVQIQKSDEPVAPVVVQVKKQEKKKNSEKEESDTVVTEADKTAEEPASDLNDEKDADKCGVFTDFVITYEAKVKDNCPGAHCSVYKRSLKRYKLKKERYCQP